MIFWMGARHMGHVRFLNRAIHSVHVKAWPQGISTASRGASRHTTQRSACSVSLVLALALAPTLALALALALTAPLLPLFVPSEPMPPRRSAVTSSGKKHTGHGHVLEFVSAPALAFAFAALLVRDSKTMNVCKSVSMFLVCFKVLLIVKLIVKVNDTLHCKKDI